MRVQGYRSIRDSGDLELGPITIFVGKNNSGKSALLRALYSLQDGNFVQASDYNYGVGALNVRLTLGEGPYPVMLNGANAHLDQHLVDGSMIEFQRVSNNHGSYSMRMENPDGAEIGMNVPTTTEPGNWFFPILSGRHVERLQPAVDLDLSRQVSTTDQHLIARASALIGSGMPEALKFQELYQRVFESKIDLFPVDQGMMLGQQIDRFTTIPLKSMGAGLSACMSILIGLATARHHVFLVEEPENDLHPGALKRLLAVIQEHADSCQFLVSTHSSIVLSRLGKGSASINHVSLATGLGPGSVPETRVSLVADEDRQEILQELGCELADLDLAEGWLIFEESSAESICKWLIPHVAPRLLGLRTIAAAGTTRVRPIFQDYKEMFTFARVEPFYDRRIWSVVDAGEAGETVTESLVRSFPSWPPTHFHNWSQENFEEYYPPRFRAKVDACLASRGQEKRLRKHEVLQEVKRWMWSSPDEALHELSASASEVIDKLRELEALAFPLADDVGIQSN